MSRTAPSIRGSVCSSSSASSTDPAGPITLAPRSCSARERSSAIMYSSSTTRSCRPRKRRDCGSIIRLVPACDRYGDLTSHPVGAELELGPGAELIRQRAFDQLAAVAFPPPSALGHGNPALVPLQRRARLRVPMIDVPSDLEPAGRLAERAIFHSVGGEFMQRKRQGLRRDRRQQGPRTFYRQFAGAAVAVRLELAFDQFAQVDRLVVASREQDLHAG